MGRRRKESGEKKFGKEVDRREKNEGREGWRERGKEKEDLCLR